MGFTAFEYLFFFVAVYLVYWIARPHLRPLILAGAGLLLCTILSWRFALDLLFILCANFHAARILFATRSKTALGLIVGANLLNLIVARSFYSFFAGEAPHVTFPAIDAWSKANAGLSSILMTLFVSLSSLQMISLQVDVYRGRIRKKPQWLEFFVFGMYFPLVMGGPVIRYSGFARQLRKTRPSEKRAFEGLLIIGIGFLKNVAIAESVDAVVTPVFGNPEAYAWSTNLLAIFGFAANIYARLSGLADIARGSSRMLGILIPENFCAPLLAPTVTRFWSRWQFSLMLWLRDYVYAPSGGAKGTNLRRSASLAVT